MRFKTKRRFEGINLNILNKKLFLKSNSIIPYIYRQNICSRAL